MYRKLLDQAINLNGWIRGGELQLESQEEKTGRLENEFNRFKQFKSEIGA